MQNLCKIYNKQNKSGSTLLGMAACLYALGFPLSRGICGHSQEDCPLSEVMMLIMFVIMIETMDIPRVLFLPNRC